MLFAVEPLDGPELDRLITALLNATGCVHQLIEDAKDEGFTDGLEIIGHCASRLRASLAVLAEHHEDDELALVTGLLGYATLLVAQDGDFDDVFRER